MPLFLFTKDTLATAEYHQMDDGWRNLYKFPNNALVWLDDFPEWANYGISPFFDWGEDPGEWELIMSWVEEHFTGRFEIASGCNIFFESENDLMWLKLRWL